MNAWHRVLPPVYIYLWKTKQELLCKPRWPLERLRVIFVCCIENTCCRIRSKCALLCITQKAQFAHPQSGTLSKIPLRNMECCHSTLFVQRNYSVTNFKNWLQRENYRSVKMIIGSKHVRAILVFKCKIFIICALVFRWYARCNNKENFEKENQKDATVRSLLSTLSQHVSGIIMPIFRRPNRVLLHVVCCAVSAGCGW